jgi:hypothetical protein
MAVIRSEDDTQCHKLSGPDPTDNAAFDVADPGQQDGLAIVYNGGAEGYGFSVNISCNKETPFTF